MKIHLFSNEKPTPEQMAEMLEALGNYAKLAVDVRRRLVAGGGEMHADCEAVLLDAGSRQEDVWGADWKPHSQEVAFESLINIRPRQGNMSMVIQDRDLRATIEQIVKERMAP
ncbi:MAG: hypothetical protein COZ06_07120 [Armatimonadetes bacterium CG_4_10_14_3_um_filter_66_18]|nr:hypothetical protein [Armatimonadota bacterium]PIU91907.1 MAG: hypothetical protein COS65_20295 [Armatimonadetes bacterium CG06_land_8_20_14_3_00_66_21]PIX47618.1 MAG: hypothetical protein COZ57_08125 [Armatimonadetes bacterium CG_4_8_14_3_um_filter_66_20]PIY50862.1 MAG: hypothetical protein COZ06_07120 [Armatimonadetes bacterium CG_4_10_14_3_um_filter_66_18]PIZ29627.1 MAG: hypothetical protein COY42_35150 [Armatimonadetes bacterium CG_4_10_14_0_8_um_filter_66_14]PJB72331.1 MAG: hypothetica